MVFEDFWHKFSTADSGESLCMILLFLAGQILPTPRGLIPAFL